MKRLLLVAAMALSIASCTNKQAGTDNAASANNVEAANKTITLAVDGMTCTGCENTIQEAVGKLAGISEIKASFLDSTALVSFDSTLVNLTAISEAITDAGYTVKGEKNLKIPVESK